MSDTTSDDVLETNEREEDLEYLRDEIEGLANWGPRRLWDEVEIVQEALSKEARGKGPTHKGGYTWAVALLATARKGPYWEPALVVWQRRGSKFEWLLAQKPAYDGIRLGAHARLEWVRCLLEKVEVRRLMGRADVAWFVADDDRIELVRDPSSREVEERFSERWLQQLGCVLRTVLTQSNEGCATPEDESFRQSALPVRLKFEKGWDRLFSDRYYPLGYFRSNCRFALPFKALGYLLGLGIIGVSLTGGIAWLLGAFRSQRYAQLYAEWCTCQNTWEAVWPVLFIIVAGLQLLVLPPFGAAVMYAFTGGFSSACPLLKDKSLYRGAWQAILDGGTIRPLLSNIMVWRSELWERRCTHVAELLARELDDRGDHSIVVVLDEHHGLGEYSLNLLLWVVTPKAAFLLGHGQTGEIPMSGYKSLDAVRAAAVESLAIEGVSLHAIGMDALLGHPRAYWYVHWSSAPKGVPKWHEITELMKPLNENVARSLPLVRDFRRAIGRSAGLKGLLVAMFRQFTHQVLEYKKSMLFGLLGIFGSLIVAHLVFIKFVPICTTPALWIRLALWGGASYWAYKKFNPFGH